MKSVTHDVFSLGVGLYLLYHVVPSPSLLDLVLVLWLAFATNELIDVLGHIKRDGRPVRSFWTHSVFTAPVWGVTLALASVYLIDGATGRALNISQEVFASTMGLVFAFTHLLLDALTEGGVYLGRRRVAIAHMRYNNRILNAFFTLLGILLIFGALT